MDYAASIHTAPRGVGVSNRAIFWRKSGTTFSDNVSPALAMCLALAWVIWIAHAMRSASLPADSNAAATHKTSFAFPH